MNLQLRSILRAALGELLDALGPAIEGEQIPDLAIPAVPRLSPLEDSIVNACRHYPRKAESIARLLGRRCDSYFRERLTHLCRDGILRRVEGGYVTG